MDSRVKNIGISALRTVILMALTLAVSALVRFLFIDNMFEQEYFSEQILNVWHMVFFLLIFNSLFFAIKRYDKNARERFLNYAKSNKLSSHIKFIFSSLDFYVEYACMVLLSIILPSSFLYGFVSKILLVDNKLYTLLIILPIMLLLLFSSRITIQRNWYLESQKESKYSAKEKNSKLPPIVKSVITVVLVYCGAAILIPWFLPLFISLWNLGGAMLFVWIALVVIAVVLITISVYYVRAILKRKSFIKKLKKYCADNSVFLSDIKKPYNSIFTLHSGFDFTVEKKGVKYDCKFIAGIAPNSIIVLSDKGNGLKQNTVRLFKTELFHFMTKFDFGYESENKKIIILLPTPKTFLVSTNESPPSIADTGEKIGQYTIYSGTGFLNSLDRNCL